MLAARDQENRVHNLQVTAATKPANQEGRTLQPKTPGNFKTPFRTAKNDENRTVDIRGQKSLLQDGLKKVDKDAYITPIQPRTRAPLGVKTTNAKAQNFKTPAPTKQSQQPLKTTQRPSTSRRSIKSKITVASSEPVYRDVLDADIEEEDEPDYGYAPPPPVELPDPPMEFPYDYSFLQAQRDNIIHGRGEMFSTSPKDETGRSMWLKKQEDMYDEYIQSQMKKSCEIEDDFNLASTEDVDQQVDMMIQAGPRAGRVNESKVNTVKAKNAAAALTVAAHPLPTAIHRPTKSSEQKRKPNIPFSNKELGPAASAAVSRNTIGFPRAKQAPSILPPTEQLRRKNRPLDRSGMTKVDQSKIHPKEFREQYGEPPVESDMWFRLKEYELLDEESISKDDDELADDLFETEFFRPEGIKSNKTFQLPDAF